MTRDAALFNCFETDLAVGMGRIQGNHSDCVNVSANF